MPGRGGSPMETVAAGPIPLVAPAPPRAVGRSVRPGAALAAGGALGLLAELLFYRRPLGVSVPLFALALVGAGLLLARASGLRARRGNIWLLAPLGFFAAM